MKKFLAFILALACALSLMACGKKNNDDKPDPDPAPDPQPTVTTAEFTHGYVDMKLELPEGWSWEQVSDNGTDKTEGIRFYKTDDPTVSYTLLCWTGGYGICGTGVTSEEITLANGMKVWQHTEENTEKGTMGMADIFFEGKEPRRRSAEYISFAIQYIFFYLSVRLFYFKIQCPKLGPI